MHSHARITLATTLVAVAALACAASPAGAAVTSSDGLVELLDCTHGKRAADRNALFRGEMRQVPEAATMRMRFNLSERVGRGSWRAVKAPGLGVWRYAQPDVARFAYRQRIEALRRGTAYRVTVTFQWHDAAGDLVERQRATSPVCRQAGPLPNVRVGSLERLPGPTAGTVRYVVSVVNRGTVPARRVEVSLLVDGAEVDTRGMGKIGARSRREIAFVGPDCTSAVVVELDPHATLRELDRRDNKRSFSCAETG
jgi:hypothetical protein